MDNRRQGRLVANIVSDSIHLPFIYSYHLLFFLQTREARLLASVSLFKALGGGWRAEDAKTK